MGFAVLGGLGSDEIGSGKSPAEHLYICRWPDCLATRKHASYRVIELRPILIRHVVTSGGLRFEFGLLSGG